MSCVEWTKARDRQGYGVAWQNGKKVSAHRSAWIKANGTIPANMCVLHRCDNPSCVNVDHLFLGTRGDNNKDRSMKGRNSDRTGEKHHCAKLNSIQVIAIRNDQRAQNLIAKDYGIDPSSVSNIKRRKNWKHI